MAQGKVTEFFSARKRNAAIQPSKRRKVQRLATVETLEPEQAIAEETKTVRVTRATRQKPASADAESKQVQPIKQAQVSIKSGRGRTRKTTSQTPKGNINTFFNVASNECSPADEATAACDDHHASPATPTSKATTKRAIKEKTAPADLLQDAICRTPESESGYNFEKFQKSKVSPEVSIRRKLHMPRKSPQPAEESSVQETSSASTADPKESSVKMVPDVRSTKAQEPKTKAVSRSKTPELAKLNPAEMKKKLQKCGKLSELREQLAKLDKGVAKIKSVREAKEREEALKEVEKDELKEQPKAKADVKDKPVTKVTPAADGGSVAKVPAYQRFHNLAQPVPPSLSLPYKYKVLAEMFHSVDTVISMLHKRTEICTFTKLKNAVQLMMRKAFEERNLGQLKTVYPMAYILRQEKGLPNFGKVTSAYQLTVEADLNNDLLECMGSNAELKPEYDSAGKPIISASRLLQRKALFQRKLVDIVKQHHKSFLETLEQPLKVPDNKITRWHPRFKVDEVPDLPAADLPQPPDVKRFQTAAEALQHATVGMNPRMKTALEIVAAKNAKNTQEKEDKKPDVNSSSPNQPKPANNAGVPQSLLERIRAKEALKQEMSMMRSPAEDQRLERIGRLPEIVRIIRTFFVTQKKPAVTVEDAITKISDSYRSSLGEVEAEIHIKLLIELCPEWISMITIRQGRYLKIDKNKDTAVIVSKLQKLAKQ